VRYHGGKEKIADKIVEVIGKVDGLYHEPFAGGLSVGCRVDAKKYVFSDTNAALISLYRAWFFEGWRPAGRIDAEEYAKLRDNRDTENPMTAFAGFGLSFGGKWFGGFARCNQGNDYYMQASNSLTMKLGRLVGKDVDFKHQDYSVALPEAPCFVYCDPPYIRTTKYRKIGPFDSGDFWRWAESQSGRLYVSEYVAPPGWEQIGGFDKLMTMRREGAPKKVIDRLFARTTSTTNGVDLEKVAARRLETDQGVGVKRHKRRR
jgi:DNA adenine methylase